MIIDIIGWIGTLLVLAAYFSVSNEKLKPTSNAYNLMNLFGAAFIGINVFYNHAWPAVALNAVWGLVAIMSLLKIRKLKSKSEARVD